jgi:radical SAM superfamily enzyme YgiQ (UPF0313 family)
MEPKLSRILLIDIDIFRDQKEAYNVINYSHHPVGLLYLASTAKEVFTDIEFRVFHTSTRKDPLGSIESIINSFEPDLIGLRSLSIAKDPFEKVAEQIRNLHPHVTVVAGGPYPSSSFRDILQAGLADIVVIGEGEKTFVDLIDALSANNDIPLDLRGTAVLHDGSVKVNAPRDTIKDVDAIPFPDYSLLDLNDYAGIKNHALQDASKCAFILSSRGCPYKCFYCHQLFGKKIRRRSAENVVAEMREHIEKRGVFDFVFLDDIFNVPMRDAKKVLTEIIESLPKIRINFPNGLRADQIDDEMLDLLEQAGTVEMALAVETAVPRLQKLIGKNLNLEKAIKAIHSASKRFIVRIFFINGFPTETYEEAMETILLAESFEYAAQPMMSVLRVYENTPLFNMLEATEEQTQMLAAQEQKELHLKLFGETEFYGDLFPRDKVPLTSENLQELLTKWMRDVLMSPNRLHKSHEVLEKHFDQDGILDFYRNVFDKPEIDHTHLKRMLMH